MKIRVIFIVMAVLVAVIGGGWYWHQDRTANGSAAMLTVYGNIDVRLVDLAFDAQGRIAHMHATEGARVKTGEVLARLDNRRLALARDAAAAKAAAQRQRVRELEAGTRPEEIRKLEAQLAAARSKSANLERSYVRIQDLRQRDLASPQQDEDARTAAEAAKEDVKALAAALTLARIGAREEVIAAAKATLTALEAETALAERNLDDAVLRAPDDGTIQSRILEPGDMASAQRPVYTLALTEPLWARVYLSETELGRVQAGVSAQVFSDSFPGKAYRGWVGYISPSAEFTPKTVQTEETRTDLVYQARVFVCDPDGELRLGMPVTVRLDLTAKPQQRPACGKDA